MRRAGLTVGLGVGGGLVAQGSLLQALSCLAAPEGHTGLQLKVTVKGDT